MPMQRKKMAGPLISIFLLLLSPLSLADQPSPEAEALMRLKASFVLPEPDPLPGWSLSAPSPPCNKNSPWPNIICRQGSVQGLRLDKLGLSGTINVDILRGLPSLRSIDVQDNHFSGPIPAFTSLPLKFLYISNNNFSGDIPDDFFSTEALKKVWINGNAFTGPVPSSLFKSNGIMEIHMENNQFSGSLPDFDVPVDLQSLNVSGNNLSGSIPQGLAKRFKAESFVGNPGLCGPPTDALCNANPPSKDVGSSPPGDHGSGSSLPLPLPKEEKKKGVNGTSIFLGVLGVVIFIGLLLVALMVARNRKDDDGKFDMLETGTEAMVAAATVATVEAKRMQAAGSPSGSPATAGATTGGAVHKRTASSGSNRGSAKKGGGGAGGSDLVMVNEEKGKIGLPDLMKAAAEILGNGSLGSAYKATLESGLTVAVKRMRELNRANKEAFDLELKRYGKLRHRNVLPPLAYMYKREEKLVVSEHISKGSLLYILHGDRGQENAALDWPTRLKIIRGVASGLTYLHAELSTLDVPHANLKSANILLSAHFEPLLMDYGYIGLVNPTQVANLLFAYKSPEFVQHSYVCPKSDVYCLGIIILEVLTGKFPTQYLNNTKGGTDVVHWAATAVKEKKEAELLDPHISSLKQSVDDMLKVLRLGVACTEQNPEKRPELKDLGGQLEEIGRTRTVVVGGEKAPAVEAIPQPMVAAPAVEAIAQPTAAAPAAEATPTAAKPTGTASTTALQQPQVEGTEKADQRTNAQTTTEGLGSQTDGQG